jgi:hypothetical protein
MNYRLKDWESDDYKNVCGDCCEDCSTCQKKEASDAIALAIEFVKYGLNKLDN